MSQPLFTYHISTDVLYTKLVETSPVAELALGTSNLHSSDRHGLRENPQPARYVEDHEGTARFAKGAESGERGCILAPVF
jgi:hypothetical protein